MYIYQNFVLQCPPKTLKFGFLVSKYTIWLPWRRGVMVIVYANGTEERGFESRQGVRVLGLHTYIAMLFYAN
jgi:hypothetical protein